MGEWHIDAKSYIDSIVQYDRLCLSGMRGEANSALTELCHEIEALQSDEYDTVLRRLVYEICDTENLTFLFKRGNAQIPYQLKRIVRSWLYPRCMQSRMPELRWFYQIFRNDPQNAEAAHSFLDDAYAQSPDDQRTQELIFERNVYSLECALHELPIGLLISNENARMLLRQCDAIIRRGNVSELLLNRYLCAKNEYLTAAASEL